MEYIFFMARIALANGQLFRELITKSAPALNVNQEQVYNIVLTQWWTRVRQSACHKTRYAEMHDDLFHSSIICTNLDIGNSPPWE